MPPTRVIIGRAPLLAVVRPAGVVGVGIVVALGVVVEPAQAGADLVEHGDLAWGTGLGAVVAVGVAVVGGALEAAVELVGDTAVAVGDDVVDIAAPVRNGADGRRRR